MTVTDETASSRGYGADARYPVIGRSAAMQRLKRDVEVISRCTGAVLISGQSGTGKDLVARGLHALSDRAQQPFIAVNCAAFPESLIDGELFGHERGAFTGATTRRAGRFEAANRGVLFLDEIGELPLTAQAKLLRVLQDGAFQRLGSSTTMQVDVRIVAATNRDLQAMVSAGMFREDLYFRINVFRVDVPPLAKREGDLALLVQHFSEKYGSGTQALSPSVWAVLAARTFRGNVRELEHVVRHAVAFARGAEIQLGHLPPELRGDARDEVDSAGGADVAPLCLALKAFEREYLLQALRHADGNRSRAARLLGISRKSLWAKLKRLEVSAADGIGGQR